MEEEMSTERPKKKMAGMRGGDGGLVWCLGVIGAAVYYIQQADSFGQSVLGIFKALVWPAIVVYQLLKFLGS